MQRGFMVPFIVAQLFYNRNDLNVDPCHFGDLVASLLYVRLVDANLIDPDVRMHLRTVCVQKTKEILANVEVPFFGKRF
jgi:hypothetical protein